ncbi:hypothetical protein SVIO_059790 [Streptomyces violaceusniger]|uniref:DUF1684 domain-containing protein n=1 Tax=Streptomyces violaceusniger TaxID=68280 RepID=A0A4D4L836_STRVO|nr:hypothetical protein SVIO_059790 [Streptomyces violaceusniger]
MAEGLEHVYDAPGQVEFELDGETFRLTAFNGKRPGSLMVLLTDATSGVTTYAANRSLQIDAPDEAGRVTLDFNRATNLPCAYTDLATCPCHPPRTACRSRSRRARRSPGARRPPLTRAEIDGTRADPARAGPAR